MCHVREKMQMEGYVNEEEQRNILLQPKLMQLNGRQKKNIFVPLSLYALPFICKFKG